MKATLKDKGWLETAVISSMIVSEKWLKDNDYDVKQLPAMRKRLREDVETGRLPNKEEYTQFEKDLLDESKDMWVVVFEGQHRLVLFLQLSSTAALVSHQVAHSCALCLPICRTEAAKLLSIEMQQKQDTGEFKEPAIRACIHSHLTDLEQVIVSTQQNEANAIKVHVTLSDKVQTILRVICAYNKNPTVRGPLSAATCSFSALNHVGSLRKGDPTAADDKAIGNIFVPAVFRIFQFIAVYGEEGFKGGVLDSDPEVAMIEEAVKAVNGRALQLPTAKQMKELLPIEPYLSTMPPFSVFLIKRLMACKTLTALKKTSCSKASSDDPFYYKNSANSPTIAKHAVAVYLCWIKTLRQ
jgi:hypothetical protein